MTHFLRHGPTNLPHEFLPTYSSGTVPTYSPGNESKPVVAPQAQWGNNEQQEGHLIRTAIPGGR